MSDPTMYRIMYQSVTRTPDSHVSITNSTPDFYRDTPMSKQKFTALVKKLFNKYNNESDILNVVCDELVSEHGFRWAPMISSAVQINLERKVSVK